MLREPFLQGNWRKRPPCSHIHFSHSRQVHCQQHSPKHHTWWNHSDDLLCLIKNLINFCPRFLRTLWLFGIFQMCQRLVHTDFEKDCMCIWDPTRPSLIGHLIWPDSTWLSFARHRSRLYTPWRCKGQLRLCSLTCYWHVKSEQSWRSCLQPGGWCWVSQLPGDTSTGARANSTF